VARDAGLPRDDFDKAMRAFMQFRKWRMNCHVRPIALERSLVSELHQYGGTSDCIALINSKVARELLDPAEGRACTSPASPCCRARRARIFETRDFAALGDPPMLAGAAKPT
jgi:hypothetical protein